MGRASVTSKKEKATKPLPTWRMAFPRQLEVLRAYAAAAGASPRVVNNVEVSKIVGIKPDTISMANGFFVAIGLLSRSEGGNVPCAEVLAYGRAHEWNAETAFHKTAPVFERAWFSEALIPKLRFGPLAPDAAIATLADAATAGPELLPQLTMTLEFMRAAGIITRDEDGTIRLAKNNGSQTGEPRPAEAAITPEDAIDAPVPVAQAKSPVAPMPGGAGVIRLSINVQVDMDRMAKWKPERITAFLGGLAQVLAAKGEAEKDEGQQQ